MNTKQYGWLIRIFFVLYVGLLAAWVIYQAKLNQYSAWPVLFLQVSPFLLFIYGIKTLHQRSLIYLNFLLLLYFCFSVMGLFVEGIQFYWAIAEVIALVSLFCTIFIFLRRKKKALILLNA